MGLKRRFNEHEKYGLTAEEVFEGEKYLRRHKTAGIIPPEQITLVYELFMVGMSFRELVQQFKQFPLGQIVLTAALKGWMHDREKIIQTIRERVQTSVVKSILEQVDFLTSMMSVANAEHLEKMRNYIRDPLNNDPPGIRIQSIKDYKEVLESLQKLLAGANGTKGHGVALFQLAESREPPPPPQGMVTENSSVATMLEAEIEDE